MRNKAHRLAALVLAGFLLAGCAATDVVKKYSKTSFAAIAEAFPGIVEDKGDAYALSVEGILSCGSARITAGRRRISS